MDMADTAQILAYFAVAWPYFQIEEQTADVWQEQAANVDRITAALAAKRLAAREERPPSIARFLEECRLVTRNSQERLEPGPEPGVLSREETKRRIQAIRRGLKVAGDMVPDHDHRPPAGSDESPSWKFCPACTTQESRRGVMEAAVRAELEDAP
jgi:hypothetical protein